MTTLSLTYREALRVAHREALAQNPKVFLMGEDVGSYGGAYAVSQGLLAEFGSERIRNTPLSETGFVGAGIGAALAGMRPIVEIMTVNFSLLALDQIINNAATIRHMSGGQFHVPLVIRMATGAGRQLAAQHSHSLEGWYAHIPGLQVIAPATVHDARWMLGQALQAPDPVLMFEHVSLYNSEGPIDEEVLTPKLHQGQIRKTGSDLSLITYGGSLAKALKAAAELARDQVDVEVVDLRSLRPLDMVAIRSSIAKTRRLLVVDEGWRSGSLSAEIIARVTELGNPPLIAPPARVCSAEVPVPYSRHMEQAALPQVASIVAAAQKVMAFHA